MGNASDRRVVGEEDLGVQRRLRSETRGDLVNRYGIGWFGETLSPRFGRVITQTPYEAAGRHDDGSIG